MSIHSSRIGALGLGVSAALLPLGSLTTGESGGRGGPAPTVGVVPAVWFSESTPLRPGRLPRPYVAEPQVWCATGSQRSFSDRH